LIGESLVFKKVGSRDVRIQLRTPLRTLIMIRLRGGGNLSIDELERMLADRKTRVTKLMKQRDKLQAKLDGLDREIVSLGGNGRGGRRTRARNDVSLVDAIETAMGKSGKPMRVGEITEAVQSAGYRSNSANFRGIVNQTLIKERKRFDQAARGLYQLKK